MKGDQAQALRAFHPAVRRWFAAVFTEPTPAQVAAWPQLHAGKSVLLLAPTGSGKTLASFLVAIDSILKQPRPDAATRVLYISPLKALGADVERNLDRPLAGIRAAAMELGTPLGELRVGVRSGDTEQKVRARLVRHPPEVLITTPESLYLMLTSSARETLRDVETVIVDEIHALAGTKRGAHLFLNLERLEAIRSGSKPLQRVGLSATQRPLDEIARLLGGFEDLAGREPAQRSIEILDVASPRRVELSVEVPVDQMGQGDDRQEVSIWPSIHPRLLELVRAHRSTMIFVNNRRLAERLANALNELAAEELVLAHHGSVAKERRLAIESRLKNGELRAVVTTSSLELGIDVGAVDLVVQVEAPVTISSGIQRIGRAGHHVGGVSRGVFFPKFLGDLVTTTAATARILARDVEATTYPRNPLDVLAQVVVAEVAQGPVPAEDLFRLVRRAAPFVELTRRSFDGVLDMLSGHYPSERFREFRARISWDRAKGVLAPRRGTRLLAIRSGGTIPDRGLFGVYVTGTEPALKVGELDEEMVFESRVGEIFLLGATSWRIDDITHDRVLVSSATGEPGKMPFWRGAGFGRSFEFGRAIGELLARLRDGAPDEKMRWLREEHRLDERAAANLVRHVDDQRARGALPTDSRVVVEWFNDELGDLRVVVLSPFGGRVHAPWLLAIVERLRHELGVDVDSTWADDGMVFRLPARDETPLLDWFLPLSGQARRAVEAGLIHTALFASHFRENAARALLLPRHGPGRRTPLWLLSRRARDLLQVSRDYPEFPIVLETFRECLSEVFDLRGLESVLDGIQSGAIAAELVATEGPSPFAASLLFSYAGNFIYESDAPLAERRAQALTLDFAQLKQLLGEPELRELLGQDAIDEVVRRLQRLETDRPIEAPDDVCDLLWELGDLSESEIRARFAAIGLDPAELGVWLDALVRERRVVRLEGLGAPRFVVVEDAALHRDALGLELPVAIPEGLSAKVAEPMVDLVLRYARTHGPFTKREFLARYPIASHDALAEALVRLSSRELLSMGAFLPAGEGEEYCHPEVLARIRQVSLGRARRDSRAVPVRRFAEWLGEWHGVFRDRPDPTGLLGVLERLEGCEFPLEDLESEILPARVSDYAPRDLDALCSRGDVYWVAASEREPRVRLFLSDGARELDRPGPPAEGELCARIRQLLEQRGASFFADLHQQLGGFEPDAFAALWRLVWAGEVTNDTLAPLRSLARKESPHPRAAVTAGYRPRRTQRPGSEGRWSLVVRKQVSDTAFARAFAQSLLLRHGLVARETLKRETLPGGFGSLYPVLRAMEEAGQVRRGYFVEGLGGAQFTHRGAETGLRDQAPEEAKAIALAACDPANPYGAVLPWPSSDARLMRVATALVVLHRGELLAYVGRGHRSVQVFVEPADLPRERALREALSAWFQRSALPAWFIETIDGLPAHTSPRGSLFEALGFLRTSDGLRLLRERG